MTKTTEMGFTLIELMVTITVAAILLGVAVPSFRSLIQDDRQPLKRTIFSLP